MAAVAMVRRTVLSFCPEETAKERLMQDSQNDAANDSDRKRQGGLRQMPPPPFVRLCFRETR
jgi:hypothetical protein